MSDTQPTNTTLRWVVFVTFLFFPVLCYAETLLWSPPPISGAVDGYLVYYGTSINDLSHHLDVGDNTQCDLNDLPLLEGATYYLRVSAYNSIGESSPSAPVVFTPGDNTPPAPPVGIMTQP